ncbi:MAG: hypothetical protein J5802_04270 [Butyrivibrio sp.]|nr:hypothetical protein [Butyrivibrio sp.]
MVSKNSFVIYTSWRSFFELLEEPELIKELLYTMFDIAEGKETAVTNNRVKSALKAIEPKMKEDLEAYEVRCEKNRKAAQKRWNNPSDMQSHAEAIQADGDTDTDSDTDSDTESDSDMNMSVMSDNNAPSVTEVLEAASHHGIEVSEADAKEFITYYYVDRKGELNGKPIRDWRKLLKSWGKHTLISTDSVLGADFEGYEAYLRLPVEIQKRIDEEQHKFGHRRITRATAMAITECGKAV